jgi:hypothetical protein
MRFEATIRFEHLQFKLESSRGDMVLGEQEIRIRQQVNKSAGLCLTLCLVGLFTAGCIAVPTPAKHKVRGQSFSETSPPLTIGKTTREEILNSLGPPAVIWESENVFIYHWDDSRSAWLVLIPNPDTGWGGYPRNWKSKFCLLRFDDEGLLTDKKIGDRPKLTGTGQYLMDWVHGEGSKESSWPTDEYKQVPLLMRLVTDTDSQVDDEPDEKWFDSSSQAIAVRLGSFNTGGPIRERGEKKRKKIERNLWYEGWQLYFVEPGDLYIAFFHVPPSVLWPGEYIEEEYYMPPVFHVDVPVSDTPVYIGSFHFNRRTVTKATWIQRAVYKNYRFVGIVDERDLARQVGEKLFPDKPAPETFLAVKHEGPVILNTPLGFE